jgi:hypothetical protein
MDGVLGTGFGDFVNAYFQPMAPDEAQQLYQLRNALMHSFGLYSKGRDVTTGKTTEYHFSLRSGASATGKIVAPLGNDVYLVCAETLHDRFEAAVEAYRADLKARPEQLQANFEKMFPYYGTTGVIQTDQAMTLDEAKKELLGP